MPTLVVAQQAAPSPAQYQSQSAPEVPGEAMPPAPPDDRVEVVRLSDAEGEVRLLDSKGQLVDQGRLNMAVLAGMRVQTGKDGRAELEFPDGSVVRITPNSALDLVSITRDEGGSAHVTLKPTIGLSYYELAQSGSTYSIAIGPFFASRNVNSGDTGEAALLRVSLDATPYEAAVLRGSIHFEDAGKEVSYDLEAKQSSRIDPTAASNYDISQELAPDTWDTWNADRDALLADLAGTHPSNDEPGGPGWSDLDYYGSWYNLPGQGEAWAPDGVDENFDPYGSGAWSYSTGVGYSWASSYPWGWLPYHCGLWSYYPSYGWMWLPANCGWGYGNGWYPYSPARGLIGYQLPLRPVPARGITHVSPSQPVVVVHRGAPVRFRGVGEPRPAPRPVVVAGETLQPRPVEPRPSYGALSGGGYVGNFRTSQGRSGMREPFQYTPAPGARVVSPAGGESPRTVAPRFTLAPPPAPRMSAPAAPPAAPHVSAPAAPAAPAGHH